MKPVTRFLSSALGVSLMTVLAAGLLWPQENSHARVVRLSYVEGTVTVQRPDVSDWAEAPVNTPIEEGFKLSTAENSFAEVQFENGSTIRLGQFSLVEFSQLALLPSGGKINRLALQQGYATFHALPAAEDVYELNTPQGRLTSRGKALFRVDLDENIERVEVLKGSVDVASNLGSWSLGKNDVLELRPGSDEPASLTQGITQDAWDEWVSQRENWAASPSGAPSPRLYSNDVSDLLYGWNDLSNYGMWSYLAGWGYGWVPTVGVGWSPYTLGHWCWYPGFGWVWISSEPWGWLPFHYGGWEFIAGIGWAWLPGNFGYFSPAQVTWYSGPGWIGWAPRGSPQGGHNSASPCPAGQACGAVVSTATFQNGAVVTPTNRLPVDPTQGHRIDRPEIPPTPMGMLPGSAIGHNPRGAPGAAPAGEPGTRAWRGASPAPNSTVAFDPLTGRYVNSNLLPRPVQSPTAGAGKSRGQEVHQPGGKPATAPGPPTEGQPNSTVTGRGSGPQGGPPREPTPGGREPTRAAPTTQERPGGDPRGSAASPPRSGGIGESRSSGSEGSKSSAAGKSPGGLTSDSTSRSVSVGSSLAHVGSGSTPHSH